jgi:hypothetical protein
MDVFSTVTVDQLVEANPRLSICELPRGGPAANGAPLFDAVLIDGVRVAISRTANGTRWFVCPRCEKICRYIYFASGPACQACLGLRRASRHQMRHTPTWSGATGTLPDGRKRRRKITFFRHFKRKSHSTAGQRRKARAGTGAEE